MSFGKTIKRLRRERDMTQDELAEILSISPQAVSSDSTISTLSSSAKKCFMSKSPLSKLRGHYSRLHFF